MSATGRRALLSSLLPITAADFLVRSAYQMGKTPLLSIFAASLGATGATLGFITSVSSLTGMLCKPLFGALSDRGGRRRWLLLATLLFVLTPFVYGYLNRPEQLVLLRLVHGLGTAIYGPVTLAYVGGLAGGRRAESFGWFSYARSGGYIVGPLLAGWLLLSWDAAAVYRIVGLLSATAFLPLFFLSDSSRRDAPREELPTRSKSQPIFASLRESLRVGAQERTVWLVGGLEALSYVALYALRAFLPIYALAAGASVFGIGSFFAAQEAANILARPFGGRLGDRWGYYTMISLGLALLALSLILLTLLRHDLALATTALTFGLAQAAIFPATLALISGRLPPAQLGTGMGILGALRNAGKVAGPLLAGALIQTIGFKPSLQFLALLVLTFAGGSLWRSLRAAGRRDMSKRDPH